MAESSPVIPQSDAQVDNALASIPAESLDRGFEARSLNIRAVMAFVITLFAGIVLILVVLWWLLSTWQSQTLVPRAQISPAVATVPSAPGPFPVENAKANLQTLVNAANANLHSYGWVDQKAGVVRIPIDRAMLLLLQRGLPARKDLPPSFGLDDAHTMDGAGGQEPGDENTTR